LIVSNHLDLPFYIDRSWSYSANGDSSGIQSLGCH